MINKSFSLIILFLACLPLFSQQTKEISHYLFPEFTPGIVLMKDGKKNAALLNFNAATEEMVFNQNGQVLALGEPSLSQTDTVFIGNRKFILHNNQFMEVLHGDGYKFLAEYKCRVIPPGKPAAYGGTSQTSSSDSYSSWASGGKVYELKLPDDFQVKPYTVYWLDKGSGWEEIKSVRQLKNLYKKRKEQYSQYTNDNKIDFEDQEAVAQLIHFMETN